MDKQSECISCGDMCERVSVTSEWCDVCEADWKEEKVCGYSKLRQLKADLSSAMKAHDWDYSYSDDMRWWRRGRDQRQIIDGLFSELLKYGRRNALLFWNEHSPASNKCVVDC